MANINDPKGWKEGSDDVGPPTTSVDKKARIKEERAQRKAQKKLDKAKKLQELQAKKEKERQAQIAELLSDTEDIHEQTIQDQQDAHDRTLDQIEEAKRKEQEKAEAHKKQLEEKEKKQKEAEKKEQAKEAKDKADELARQKKKEENARRAKENAEKKLSVEAEKAKKKKGSLLGMPKPKKSKKKDSDGVLDTLEHVADKTAELFGLSNTFSLIKNIGKLTGKVVGTAAKVGVGLPYKAAKWGLSSLLDRSSSRPTKAVPTSLNAKESEESDLVPISQKSGKAEKSKGNAFSNFFKGPQLVTYGDQGRGLGKKADRARSDAQESTDSALMRRQVRALEDISKKKSKGGGSSDGVGGFLSSILDKLSDGFKLLPALATAALAAAVAVAAFEFGTKFVKPAADDLAQWVAKKLGMSEKDVKDQTLGTLTYHGVNAIQNAIPIFGDSDEDKLAGKSRQFIGTSIYEGVDYLQDKGWFPGKSDAQKMAEADAAAKKARKPKGITSAPKPTSAPDSKAQPAPSVTGTSKTTPQSVPTTGLKPMSGIGSGEPVTSSNESNLAGSSLSDAKGKLFKTPKSEDSLDNVDPAVQANFTSMAAEYKERGGKGTINLNSAFRTYQEQAAEYAKDPTKAAPPGKSAHGYGVALDINSKEADELDSMGLLEKYGFARPVRKEKWHLQAINTAGPLAEAGVVSADDATDQMKARAISSGRSSDVSQAAPVRESVPPAPMEVKQPSREAPAPARQSVASAGGGPKSNAQPVSTFSYMDGGFFIMNSGMMTA